MKHTFLLIHGAWHGAWCWDRLIQTLEQQGHTALAIDLPGHGADTSATPGWNISMQSYVDAVNTAARRIQEDGKLHLVGHSMGGAVISCAAEQAPELYASLTYVAAFLLQPGQSLVSYGRTMDAPTIVKAVRFPNLFTGCLKVTSEHSLTKAAFYNQCAEEDIITAHTHLCPQSIRPVMAGVQTSDEKWGKIPRYYVFCENDQAFPVVSQRELEQKLPCQKTVALDTDHSPFVSDTARLAAALTDFAVHAATLSGAVA